MPESERARFETELRARLDSVVELCAELIRVPSENPPGDTTSIAALIEAKLSQRPEVRLRRVVAQPPVVNLLAKLSGTRSGRRLVINGHLDTFPAGDRAKWTVDPFGGVLRQGRLYGRGAADMKAGIAAALSTMALMAQFRDAFAGELILTLVGDEETGARLGTQYLLASEPDAIGDAMINGDAGSPDVLRFGEKGQLWISIEARGRSHHGAHVSSRGKRHREVVGGAYSADDTAERRLPHSRGGPKRHPRRWASLRRGIRSWRNRGPAKAYD